MARIEDLDELLSVTMAASLIGVTTSTIWNRVNYGWLEEVRICGRAYFRRHDVLNCDKRQDAAQ